MGFMEKETKDYKHVAVLLLGGLGTRFNESKPKQFLPMGGKPLCLYGAEALENSPSVDFILYVIPDGYMRNFALLLSKAGHKKPSETIIGGKSRQESSKIAVKYLLSNGFDPSLSVLLQDGDRPNLKERYIQENFENADEYLSSVTAIKATDSVAISKEAGLLDGYIPRNEVYLLQTPQAFRLSLLDEAEDLADKDGSSYSDEGSLVLYKKGVQPRIVIGERANLKITAPEDKNLFERIKG